MFVQLANTPSEAGDLKLNVYQVRTKVYLHKLEIVPSTLIIFINQALKIISFLNQLFILI